MDFKVTHGDTFTFPVAYTLADDRGAALDAQGVTLVFNLKPALAVNENYRSVSVVGNPDGTFPAISLAGTEDLPPATLYYELLYNQGGTGKTLLTGKLQLVTYAVDSHITASNLTFAANNTPMQLVVLPEVQAAGNYASETKTLRDSVVLLHGEVTGFKTDFSNYLNATEAARDVAESSKQRVVAAEAQVAIAANSVAADRDSVETVAAQVATDAAQVATDAAQVADARSATETLYNNTVSTADQAVSDLTTVASGGTVQINNAIAAGKSDIESVGRAQTRDIDAAGQHSFGLVSSAESDALASLALKKSQVLAVIDTQAQQRLDAMDVLHDSVADAKRSVDTSEQYVALLESSATSARNEVLADSGSTTNAMFTMATGTTIAMTNLLTMLNKDR